MKRPLHMLIVGLLLAIFGVFATFSPNYSSEAGIVVLYTVPIFTYGLVLVLAYTFSPWLQKRFSNGALYALSLPAAILADVLLVIGLLAT